MKQNLLSPKITLRGYMYLTYKKSLVSAKVSMNVKITIRWHSLPNCSQQTKWHAVFRVQFMATAGSLEWKTVSVQSLGKIDLVHIWTRRKRQLARVLRSSNAQSVVGPSRGTGVCQKLHIRHPRSLNKLRDPALGAFDLH